MNVYAVPFTNPVTVHDNAPVDAHVLPPGAAVTVYPVTADPPSDTGTPHDTTTRASPATPDTPDGADGTPVGGAASSCNNSTRFCVVGIGNALFDVNRPPGRNTEPGGVPIALFDELTGPTTPPAAPPNVTAPALAVAPLSQNGLVTT